MRASKEIVWILEGRSPDQIPMARLAEYMQQLAILLGETADVHFDRIEQACTKLVAKINSGGPIQRAQARVHAVRERSAPPDAMRAFDRVNTMVAEDRGPARITFGASVVLRFPGAFIEPPKAITLRDDAIITGRLYALIEENNGQLKARIRPRGGENYVACTADGKVGRELRNYFQDAVRVHGHGTWTRSGKGGWQCSSMHIREVHPVKDVSLREAINALRAISVDWPDDPLAEWDNEERGDAA